MVVFVGLVWSWSWTCSAPGLGQTRSWSWTHFQPTCREESEVAVRNMHSESRGEYDQIGDWIWSCNPVGGSRVPAI